MPTAMVAEAFGTIDRRHPSAFSGQMPLASMTCTGTFGNGLRTATGAAWMGCRLTARPKQAVSALIMCFAVVAGSTTQAFSARPADSGSSPRTGTTMLVSVLGGRLPPELHVLIPLVSRWRRPHL